MKILIFWSHHEKAYVHVDTLQQVLFILYFYHYFYLLFFWVFSTQSYLF